MRKFLHELECKGSITCKEGIENLALTGKVVGRRSRGRRRMLRMDSLQKLLEERGVKELGVVLIQKARSRGLWNSMVAKEKEREREEISDFFNIFCGLKKTFQILIHKSFYIFCRSMTSVTSSVDEKPF